MPLLELVDRSTEDAMVEPMEAPVHVVEDLRGPPARGAVQTHRQQRPPSYTMIFDPPSLQNRRKDKLYGKRCLKQEYPIQHKCYVDNYRRTHAWIDEGQSSSHLPEGAFTLEDPSVRDALKKIISENKDDLMDLKLGRTKKYAWKEVDVYKKIRKNLKHRRWKQRKAEKNANSDTGGPLEACEGLRSPSPLQLPEFSCPSEAEPSERSQSETMPNRRELEP